jgi:Tetrapyrrole (Corrin/Porphyrin) Methylases
MTWIASIKRPYHQGAATDPHGAVAARLPQGNSVACDISSTVSPLARKSARAGEHAPPERLGAKDHKGRCRDLGNRAMIRRQDGEGRMRKILIIGIGAGNPDYVTVQAINALNRADVFFIPDKGAEKAALRELRTTICERYIKKTTYRMVDYKIPQRAAPGESYRVGVDEWHAVLEAAFEGLFSKELSESECGAFLVWGDPALYDSTLRIVEKVRSKGFALEYEVIWRRSIELP